MGLPVLLLENVIYRFMMGLHLVTAPMYLAQCTETSHNGKHTQSR